MTIPYVICKSGNGLNLFLPGEWNFKLMIQGKIDIIC